jgi:hypothetical protein
MTAVVLPPPYYFTLEFKGLRVTGGRRPGSRSS